MRITVTTGAILQALASGCRYGFDLMDATGLPSGTVYPALRRLERQELVRSSWESAERALASGRPRRRYYTLSAEGEAALATAIERFPLLRGAGIGAARPAES